ARPYIHSFPTRRSSDLVEVAAVKLREAESVAREMRGSPIENHGDAGLVAAVDEFHKFRGRAKAARGRKVAERLVAPGAVIGMLRSEEHTSELQSLRHLV